MIRFVKPLALVMAVLSSAPLANAQTPGSVAFKTTLVAVNGKWGTKHYAVAWVTRENGTFIKTLWKQGESSFSDGEWSKNCPSWSTARGSSTAFDGYTSATAADYTSAANNPIDPVWNCLDAADKLVADGNYKFWVQYGHSDAAGPVTTNGLLWTKRSTAFSTSFTNTGSFTGMTIDWTPSATPEIAVEQPVGTNLTDGSATVNHGSVNLGTSSNALTFTVKNTGTAALTGVSITKNGTHASDFTVSSVATSVAAGGSTTFTVMFTPGAAGTRTAAIHILSNDANESPFDINLTGTGISAYDSWAIDSGLGAGADPLAAPKGDRVTNLEKFAFKLDASKADTRRLVVGAGGLAGLPGTMVGTGPVLRMEFIRRRATTHPGITYTAQFGSDLTGWTTASGTPDPIDATWERVVVEDLPPHGSTERFGRVMVSQP